MDFPEVTSTEGLVPIPAPDTVPEIPSFPVPDDALRLEKDEYDLSNVRVAREGAAELAGLTAAKHEASVDTGDVKGITSELTDDASRAGRAVLSIIVEWHDKSEDLPLDIDPKEAQSAVGYVVLRVIDNQQGWFKDSRPDHDFGEPNTQQAALLQKPGEEPGNRPPAADSLSEDFSVEDFPELSGIPSGQTGRGLGLVEGLSLALGHYVTDRGKAVVSVLPAHRSGGAEQAA